MLFACANIRRPPTALTRAGFAHTHAGDRGPLARSGEKPQPLFVRSVLVQVVDEQHGVSCAERNKKGESQQ